MNVDFVIESEDDILYEEDVARVPYELKPWLRYLRHKRGSPQNHRNMIYERALSFIPGSYKLWLAYLEERVVAAKGVSVDHPAISAVNNVFDRALIFMYKMPRIWQEYLKFLTKQCLITRTRRAFDLCLQSLPLTQHNRIWPLYLKFVKRVNLPELSRRVYRRYLKIEPSHVELYVETLVKMGKLGEAATWLARAVNDEKFVSLRRKSRHDLWMELCDIVSKNPQQVTHLDVDSILRQGISKYTAEVGRLWVALADFYIRSGHFEKARDIFHESITTVITVRDFSLVFDAYTQFEESLITAKMEQTEEEEGEQANEGKEGSEDNWSSDLVLFDDAADDVDLRLIRLEQLMTRRPELLNSVMLRQNPHNVQEWHKRAKVFADDPRMVVRTYSQAVQTVNPRKAKGKPHTLWVAFAKYYEEHGSLDNARKTFETAVKAPFRSVDDLAAVWCEYAELELRHKQFNNALEVMRKATSGWRRYGKRNLTDDNVAVQQRVHKSVRLWSLYVDLQESLGTVEETKEVYDQMIQIKVVTPQHIINLATLLEEAKYFEESFKAYEKGVALFHHPHVKDIWAAYLTKFLERYGGSKLERARDLFEQALDGVPADQAKALYLMYAKLEEDHGLARRAMAIYERATQAVDTKTRFEMFEIYIARAAEFFGVTRTREIFEKAVESVPDDRVKDICVRYAALERKLGEIDRARAIYVHMSQFCDPRSTQKYWKLWHEFEVAHGNEDTFRDMLRVKRNVQAQYAQTNFAAPATPAAAADKGPGGEPKGNSLVDQMQALEQQATASMRKANNNATAGANTDTTTTTAQDQGTQQTTQRQSNPEELELDDDDDDDDDEMENQQNGQGGGEVAIEQMDVPAAVFGSAAAARDQSSEPKGALERFQAK